jgi:hypothetical protein
MYTSLLSKLNNIANFCPIRKILELHYNSPICDNKYHVFPWKNVSNATILILNTILRNVMMQRMQTSKGI